MNTRQILPWINHELAQQNLSPTQIAAARRIALLRALARVLGISAIDLLEILIPSGSKNNPGQSCDDNYPTSPKEPNHDYPDHRELE